MPCVRCSLGHCHEPVFEGAEVDRLFGCLEFGGEIHALLNHLEPLTGSDFRGSLIVASRARMVAGVRLRPRRFVVLDGLKVRAHGAPLSPALGQSGLVLVGHLRDGVP